MKNTILFDLDGTLLDTLTDLTAAVNHAMSTLGLRKHTVEEVRSYVGDGYILLMERACGGDKERARKDCACSPNTIPSTSRTTPSRTPACSTR